MSFKNYKIKEYLQHIRRGAYLIEKWQTQYYDKKDTFKTEKIHHDTHEQALGIKAALNLMEKELFEEGTTRFGIVSSPPYKEGMEVTTRATEEMVGISGITKKDVGNMVTLKVVKTSE